MEQAIADCAIEMGARLTVDLARVLGGSPPEANFAKLVWSFKHQPKTVLEGGEIVLRPGDGAHFRLGTSFQNVPVEGVIVSTGSIIFFIFYVVNGGTSQGFSDLVSFGAALEILGPA